MNSIKERNAHSPEVHSIFVVVGVVVVAVVDIVYDVVVVIFVVINVYGHGRFFLHHGKALAIRRERRFDRGNRRFE